MGLSEVAKFAKWSSWQTTSFVTENTGFGNQNASYKKIRTDVIDVWDQTTSRFPQKTRKALIWSLFNPLTA